MESWEEILSQVSLKLASAHKKMMERKNPSFLMHKSQIHSIS
jgi:hypothetical protein